MHIKNEDINKQLRLCRQYFASGEMNELNEIFLPLLDKGLPEALLTKVDFLMQQDPDQGIRYLLHLAKKNTPMANYKMAMLLYFHPELTLNFNTFLKQAYLLQEVPAISVCAYLAYANQHTELAQQILLSHSEFEEINELTSMLGIDSNNAKIKKPSYQTFKRSENSQHSLHYHNNDISLATVNNFLNEFECMWLKLKAQKS
ncbi:MAG: hypothetical protein OQK03_12990, partial [Colwellia sp.]|nr:hypothetical protein [Colwellia sp.]